MPRYLQYGFLPQYSKAQRRAVLNGSILPQIRCTTCKSILEADEKELNTTQTSFDYCRCQGDDRISVIWERKPKTYLRMDIECPKRGNAYSVTLPILITRP